MVERSVMVLSKCRGPYYGELLSVDIAYEIILYKNFDKRNRLIQLKI
jgi:hypothetical protein